MIDNVFIFKSEHPDFPHDFYVILKCAKTKHYTDGFPCTGRIIKENDPEFIIKCDKEYYHTLQIINRKTNKRLFDINIDHLSYDELTTEEEKDIYNNTKLPVVHVYRPSIMELFPELNMDDAHWYTITAEHIGEEYD
jgi:hypothetical protein